MPANATWVCFACRRTLRRGKIDRRHVACPDCGRDFCDLGSKIAVPRKADDKGWKQLQALWRQWRQQAGDQRRQWRVRRRHALEREIAQKENEPVSPATRRELQFLRQVLDQI
jgi:hypothetical protein